MEANHIEHASGVFLLKSTAWDKFDTDVIIKSNFCTTPKGTPSDLIFYSEALAVTSNFLIAMSEAGYPIKVIIYTDNTNTSACLIVYMHYLLYNSMLCLATNRLIDGDHKLKVQYILSTQNLIANLVLCKTFTEAKAHFPSLTIEDLTPSQEALGVSKAIDHYSLSNDHGFHSLMHLGELMQSDNAELHDNYQSTNILSIHIGDDHFKSWLLTHKADASSRGTGSL
ncbi:hypothetical protein C0995_007554 [Termitomyces sp. Mi166|nr:hypothetical protein C0995_007554 [Termitomyces sp. Mi166\